MNLVLSLFDVQTCKIFLVKKKEMKPSNQMLDDFYYVRTKITSIVKTKMITGNNDRKKKKLRAVDAVSGRRECVLRCSNC